MDLQFNVLWSYSNRRSRNVRTSETEASMVVPPAQGTKCSGISTGCLLSSCWPLTCHLGFLRLLHVCSPHSTYILSKVNFQSQEETVLVCLAAQHKVGNPQANMGHLSHPAAERWHQRQLSAWTVSQTWHLTQLLGHRQSDNLVITHNQMLR